MRIQHNIMAMNAYRNYTNNTSALSKNLEKLSSGYKINRAGDDAAGLAISEKMRAQITGLETAQKNAKDGISLVQTAEGALTEVHDMLNRMVELADQSANGTYDNEVDRANLNKELEQLKSEINRIADSSNFNGIKLLDGSLDASGTAGGAAIEINYDSVTTGTAAVTAQNPSFTANLDGLVVKASSAGTNVSVQVTVGTHTFTLSATAAASGGEVKASGLSMASTTVSMGGLQYTVTGAGGVLNFVLASTVASSALAGSNVTLNPSFTISANATNGTLTSDLVNPATQIITAGRAPAAAKPATAQFELTADMLADGASIKIGNTTMTIDYTSTGVAGTTIGVKDLLDANGKFDQNKLSDAASRITQAANGNGVFTVGNNAGTITLQTLTTLGTNVDISTTDAVKSLISITGATTAGKALTLQIGDTSDSYNQLNVSVQDMHTNTLGIADITIADQAGAQAAVDKIKAAINTVSSVRGDLGATQNRLDHTINNLSVMTENIQDAESTIRDTDVAEEMMAYTKNNILVQSAQAMLAQANQVPQGVLQLLQ